VRSVEEGHFLKLAQFINYAAFVFSFKSLALGGYLSAFWIGYRVWLCLMGKAGALAYVIRDFFFLKGLPVLKSVIFPETIQSPRITGFLAIILLPENYECCIPSYRVLFHFQLARNLLHCESKFWATTRQGELRGERDPGDIQLFQFLLLAHLVVLVEGS